MHDVVTPSKGAFALRRLGTIMEPEPGNPYEVEGVLNPAAARGPDGNLYLFPRLVAAGNYSRIGIARVRFSDDGDPTGVERLGIALEPEADYELRPDGSGGCEDPRVTFVEPLASYIMTYTAFSPDGPRIALAISKDLFHWQRMGLVNFTNYHDGRDPDGVDDKDASLFPVAIPNPSGRPELAILHRPLFPGTRPEETALHPATRNVDLNRESIWISYCERAPAGDPLSRFGRFASHHRLAQLIATGTAPEKISAITGYSPSYISSLQGDPTFGELLAYYGANAELIFIDVMERMKTLGLASLEILQERIDSEPDTWTKRELMELSELMLVKPRLATALAQGASSRPAANISISFVAPREGLVISQEGETIDVTSE